MFIYCHRAALLSVTWREHANPRTGEIPSVTLSPGAVHQGQVKPHLPSFLLAPALFCFADGFFIYFGCCRELRGGKKPEGPVTILR